MLKNHPLTFALGALLALLAGPWAAAQTVPTAPMAPTPAVPSTTPAANPGAAKAPIKPLNNPLNRNPARRVLPLDNSPPPPDPRDSSTRPALPPGSSDGRDAVLPMPEAAASDARRP
jgi:hypothetical protein